MKRLLSLMALLSLLAYGCSRNTADNSADSQQREEDTSMPVSPDPSMSRDRTLDGSKPQN